VYEDGTFSLTVRLIDASDASVAYARESITSPWSGDLFGRGRRDSARALRDARANLTGIHANETGKAPAQGSIRRVTRPDARLDYWRDYDPGRESRAPANAWSI